MSQLVPDGRNGVATRGESRSWRVGFGATLALAMGISPVVLYSLNVLSPFVISDLGLSRTAFGSLASLSFAVAIPCSYFGGRAVDRIGGRRLLFGLVVTAIISVLLVARADAFGWLVGAAAVAGLSQSMANPVTNHLVSAFVRRGHQGMLMGVKQSGVQMSQFATGIALPPLALLIGWRGAMTALLVPAFGALALAGRFVPPDAANREAVPRGSSGAGRAVAWWLCGYLFLVGVAIQAANAYLPLYAFEVLGLPAALAGSLAGIVGGVGVVSRLGWGWVGGRSPDPGRLLTALAVAATVAFAAIAAAGSIGGVPLLIVGVAGYAATAAAANVVVMLAVVQTAPRGTTGRATGILAIGLFSGFACGPVAFGALVDATGSYRLGWILAAAFCAASAVAAAGWRRSVQAAPTVAG